MKGAGMTRHTYRAHIQRLIRFGLVEVEERPGEHGGNIYTIYLPEEVVAKERAHRGDRGDRGDRGEKVPGVQGSLSDPCDPSVSVESTIASGSPKTLIKTNTERSDDDDDATTLAGLNTRLKKAVKELTGKDLSPAERERWNELAEVLITELKIAAARTTVSSVPSFLAEHLRRRLWKTDKKQLEGAEKGAGMGEMPSTRIDASKCPDCGGSGFYYPQGYEGGVAKCRHQKLEAASGSEQDSSDQL
jgi:hypothetical protein